MSDQYKGPIRQSFAWWDAAGADIPMGLFSDFDEKFKAWETRRGFRSEEDENAPPKPLRGSALSAKIASEERKAALLKFRQETRRQEEKEGYKVCARHRGEGIRHPEQRPEKNQAVY